MYDRGNKVRHTVIAITKIRKEGKNMMKRENGNYFGEMKGYWGTAASTLQRN